MQLSVEYIVLGVITVIAVLSYAIFRTTGKKRFYGQSYDDDTAYPPEKLSAQKRKAGVRFLSIWLFFWTFGLVLALRKWLALNTGDTELRFISIWLIFAIPGWFYAAWTLFRLLRGDNIEFYLEEGD